MQQAASGRSFTEFAAKYIDGREPFPWQEVLPLAGLRLTADSIREPRIGVSSSTDSSGTLVLEVVPGSMAERAGGRVGDRLISVGGIPATGEEFGFQFRLKYAEATEGIPIPIVLERGAERLTLPGTLTLLAREIQLLEFDPEADARAVKIRRGMLLGEK